MVRLLHEFGERFPRAAEAAVSLAYFEVTPAAREATLKEVLLTLFTAESSAHRTH